MEEWQSFLEGFIEKKPFLAVRFSEDEWRELRSTFRGHSEFTIIRRHKIFKNVTPPMVSLLIIDGSEQVYIAVMATKKPAATLDTLVRLTHIQPLALQDLRSWAQLNLPKLHIPRMRKLLDRNVTVPLTPGLSSAILSRLLSAEGNNRALENISNVVAQRKKPKTVRTFQRNAIKTALAIFGVRSNETPASMYSLGDDATTLTDTIPVYEEAVITHDAVDVPEYNLLKHEITGKVTFEKEGKILEVYTANRTPLEKLFGVDLIYYNEASQNIVMLQYKMLEREFAQHFDDWAYRPNRQFEEELARMRRFSEPGNPRSDEYRLNPEAFYFKFVKKNADANDGGFIVPLEHYEMIRVDPAFKGSRGGIKISYNRLSGRYLRHTNFIDLMSSGYIGSYAKTTEAFRTLIQMILDNGNSVVAAIEREFDEDGDTQHFSEPQAYYDAPETEDKSNGDLPF